MVYEHRKKQLTRSLSWPHPGEMTADDRAHLRRSFSTKGIRSGGHFASRLRLIGSDGQVSNEHNKLIEQSTEALKEQLYRMENIVRNCPGLIKELPDRGHQLIRVLQDVRVILRERQAIINVDGDAQRVSVYGNGEGQLALVSSDVEGVFLLDVQSDDFKNKTNGDSGNISTTRSPARLWHGQHAFRPAGEFYSTRQKPQHRGSIDAPRREQFAVFTRDNAGIAHGPSSAHRTHLAAPPPVDPSVLCRFSINRAFIRSNATRPVIILCSGNAKNMKGEFGRPDDAPRREQFPEFTRDNAAITSGPSAAHRTRLAAPSSVHPNLLCRYSIDKAFIRSNATQPVVDLCSENDRNKRGAFGRPDASHHVSVYEGKGDDNRKMARWAVVLKSIVDLARNRGHRK